MKMMCEIKLQQMCIWLVLQCNNPILLILFNSRQ